MDENAISSGERLHKILARAGVASRRDCEKLILAGRVKVDGKTIREMGVKVDPESQVIKFDDMPVHVEAPAYYLVYKPKGVVCTTDDQFDRRTVVSLVRDRKARRLFPVGRMEEDSEGLIIVTNDGTFTNKMVSWKNPLRQTWFVKARGEFSQEALDRLREGVWLSDGRTGPMWVKVQRWGKNSATMLISPSAQQHRLLRRAIAKVGLVADKVVRTRIGALTTENLSKGHARRLKAEEVEALLNPRPEDLQRSEGGSMGGTRRRRPQAGGGRRGGPPSRGGAQGTSRRGRHKVTGARKPSTNGRGGARGRDDASGGFDDTPPSRRRVLGP